MKRMIHTIRTSVTVKSLAFVILLTTGILFCMELVTVTNINRFEQKTLENYRNSIEMYCDYWNSKLEIINRSIIQLTSTGNEDMAYWFVCNSQKTLELETNKMMLMKSVSEIARNHQNEIMVFCYVPEKNIYIKSTNNLVKMEKRRQMDSDVKEYVMQDRGYNSTKWTYFESGEKSYFMNVFSLYGGYIGSLVPCEMILEDLMGEKGIVCETVLTDNAGNNICVTDGDKKDNRDIFTLKIEMECLKYDLQFHVLQKYLFSDRRYIETLSFITVLVGIFLLIGNIVFQMKYVLGPLNILKRAMKKFSQGRFDTRLSVNHKNTEINVLFQTFNEMIIQISSLKIQVYESRLEQERIQSNYLRVQIQPHFYTNILTLIYGLAQVKDYKAIQKLAMTTGSYFRYLLGEKGTFVKLREELDCVRNYIEIQKMRYGECLEFSLDVEEGLENQMVLPMVLQTFVGNCIKHNVTLVGVLMVQIRVKKAEGTLIFEIEDNGTGFEQDILEKINSGGNISDNGEHIGISNVKERMKLFYGENASVEIQSEKGCTIVKIEFQELITEEEKDEYYSGR